MIAGRIARVALLILIGFSIAVLWLYCSGFLPTELIGLGVVAPVAERAAGTVTLITLFVAPALPIYRLFPSRSVIAAMSIGWIPLFLSLALAYQTDLVILPPFSTGFALLEGVSWIVSLGVVYEM